MFDGLSRDWTGNIGKQQRLGEAAAGTNEFNDLFRSAGGGNTELDLSVDDAVTVFQPMPDMKQNVIAAKLCHGGACGDALQLLWLKFTKQRQPGEMGFYILGCHLDGVLFSAVQCVKPIGLTSPCSSREVNSCAGKGRLK